jgi:histone deacetylase 1/2
MSSFHTDEYVHFLNRVTPETAEQLTYNGTRCQCFGVFFLVLICSLAMLVLVGEDNPAFEGVFEFCSISAGGSICEFVF